MGPETRRPLIFDIHRYALDDGPGIRSTVFFKGCPLNCIWCHNPEGICSGPELFYQPRECIACGECLTACPRQALSLEGPLIRVDRRRCDACGQCAARCPAKALTIKGHYHEPGALVAALLQDRRFVDHSNGGVTFSGGEPTRWPRYLGHVAQRLKSEGVHLALQTCGQFVWDAFAAQLLPWLDLIFFDLKCLDPELHRRWTGRSNRTILANFAKLTRTVPDKLVCTIPLIGGLTAAPLHLQAVAEMIRANGRLPYRLHPYHPAGPAKAAGLGKSTADAVPAGAMAPEVFRQISTTFESLVRG
jgi:pyruvate formate lyase activating enzyme